MKVTWIHTFLGKRSQPCFLELSAKSYAENAQTIKTAPHFYEFIEICRQIFLTVPWVGDCNMVRMGRLGFACILLLIPELAL